MKSTWCGGRMLPFETCQSGADVKVYAAVASLSLSRIMAHATGVPTLCTCDEKIAVSPSQALDLRRFLLLQLRHTERPISAAVPLFRLDRCLSSSLLEGYVRHRLATSTAAA